MGTENFNFKEHCWWPTSYYIMISDWRSSLHFKESDDNCQSSVSPFYIEIWPIVLKEYDSLQSSYLIAVFLIFARAADTDSPSHMGESDTRYFTFMTLTLKKMMDIYFVDAPSIEVLLICFFWLLTFSLLLNRNISKMLWSILYSIRRHTFSLCTFTGDVHLDYFVEVLAVCQNLV